MIPSFLFLSFSSPLRRFVALVCAVVAAGFLKSRRDRRKEKDNKKVSKKKRDSDASSVKSEGGEPNLTIGGVSGLGGVSLGAISGGDSSGREKERSDDLLHPTGGVGDASATTFIATSSASDGVRVDDEGYTIRPRDEAWSAEKTSGFYSSSDADSGTR